MASFKVHEDENSKSAAGLYHNDGKNKRHILGDIQNNFSRPFASLKRGTSHDSSNCVPSGVIENIKALGIKDKPNVTCQSEKSVSLSPDKEFQHILKEQNKHFSDKGSENIDDKENLKATVASKCVKSKDTLTLEDEATNSSYPDSIKDDLPKIISDTDENNEVNVELNDNDTVGSETPQISRLEISKTILDDIFSTTYYKDDVFKYLQKQEKKFLPSAYYMRRQPEITHSMRTILVDWLVEVGEEYNLCCETLFMAISLTDRFLSYMAITKAKLQLLGTAAMMVASKFEEIYPPEAGAFVYITDDSYTISQLIRMERLLLKVLQFDISSPTIYSFLTLLFSCERAITKVFYLATYLAELTLLEADPYLQFYPSMIASGAVVVARHSLDCKDIWPASHVKLTGYTLSQLVPVINSLNSTHQRSFTSSQQAIRSKYASAKFRSVSQIPFRKLTLRES